MNGLCSYAQILISYAYLSLVGLWRGEQPHFPATCSLFLEARFTPGSDPVPIPYKECLNSALQPYSTYPICENELLISLGQEKSSQQFYSCVYSLESSINTALNLFILREMVQHELQEVTQESDSRAAAIHSPTHPQGGESGVSHTWAAKLLFVPKKHCMHFCFHDWIVTEFLLLHFHHIPQAVNLPVGALTGIHRTWGKNWRPVELKPYWGRGDQRTTLTKLLYSYSKSYFQLSWQSYSVAIPKAVSNRILRWDLHLPLILPRNLDFVVVYAPSYPAPAMEPVPVAIHWHSWHCNSPDATLWILIFFPYPL